VHVRCERDCVATASHPLCVGVGAPGAGVYPVRGLAFSSLAEAGFFVLGGFDSLKWAGKNISVDVDLTIGGVSSAGSSVQGDQVQSSHSWYTLFRLCSQTGQT